MGGAPNRPDFVPRYQFSYAVAVTLHSIIDLARHLCARLGAARSDAKTATGPGFGLATRRGTLASRSDGRGLRPYAIVPSRLRPPPPPSDWRSGRSAGGRTKGRSIRRRRVRAGRGRSTLANPRRARRTVPARGLKPHSVRRRRIGLASDDDAGETVPVTRLPLAARAVDKMHCHRNRDDIRKEMACQSGHRSRIVQLSWETLFGGKVTRPIEKEE